MDPSLEALDGSVELLTQGATKESFKYCLLSVSFPNQLDDHLGFVDVVCIRGENVFQALKSVIGDVVDAREARTPESQHCTLQVLAYHPRPLHPAC